ncbi:MAG: PepSY-associated TM helix domain-containing protein [Hyphomonadaceae bacterium]
MGVMARLRRLWLDVHLWIGVGLSIPIIILGITGAVLVWHEDMERWLHPERHAVSEGAMLTPSAYFAAADEAFGDAFAVTQIRMPEEAGEPVVANARAKGRPPEGQRPETRTAWLDPPTGNVLAIANPRAEMFGIMHVLHGSLMIPDIGRKVVGWIGWAMTISCITGIWLWWPRNNAILKALRWRRSPSTNFNLHHMIGFWIAIPLAVLSLTGVYISFPQTARAWTAAFVQMSPQREGQGGGGPRGGAAPMLRIQTDADAVAQAALALTPGGELALIARPTQARGEGPPPAWRVGVRVEGEEQPINISVADATGAAKLPEPRAEAAGDGVPMLMRRIHDGVGMGIVWQTIIFVGGIGPVILAVTGFVMWMRRRARRRALKHGPDAELPQDAKAAENAA